MNLPPDHDPSTPPEFPPYSKLNFTDVGQYSFRSKLPFTINAFVSHVERRANEVREALRECWVSAAAAQIAKHIEVIRAERGDSALGLVQGNGNDPNPNDSDANKPQTPPLAVDVAPSLNSLDSGEEYDKWYEEVHGDSNNSNYGGGSPSQGEILLNQRIAAENLLPVPPGGGGGNNGQDTNLQPLKPPNFNRVNGIFDAASTLMSRQLRSSTEESLYAFADFFERFSLADDSGDSAFSLNLKINENFTSINKDDPEYDPNAPRDPCVLLDPSIDELKDQATACIDQIIGSAQNFPRPDSLFNPTDPVPNFTPSNSPLGPCAVTEDDDVVIHVKNQVCDAIDKHFEAPQKLVTMYDEFYSLLNGEKEEEVQSALDDRKEKDSVLASLEHLLKKAKELTQISDGIKSASDDLAYFPMFMVNCFDVKTKLSRISDNLLSSILTTVASDNHDQMTRMGAEYQVSEGAYYINLWKLSPSN